VREQQNLYRATELLIEDKASGTQLIQELIAEGCHGVTRYQPVSLSSWRRFTKCSGIASRLEVA
jgi:hypothetical protein